MDKKKYKPAGYKFLDHITEILLPYQPDDDEERPLAAEVPSWDEYFHALAQVVALRSKDRGRKVGAVIVGAGGEVVSTGFNWLPRGIRETEERVHDAAKLPWTTHAETNAIYNAARVGASLVGATIYATTYPCCSCAHAIVQSGIARVFTYGGYWIKLDPPNHWENAPDIFAEAKISVDAPNIRAKDVHFHDLEKRSPKGTVRRVEAPRGRALTANLTGRAPKRNR